jgi:hypothetical protein
MKRASRPDISGSQLQEDKPGTRESHEFGRQRSKEAASGNNILILMSSSTGAKQMFS